MRTIVLVSFLFLIIGCNQARIKQPILLTNSHTFLSDSTQTSLEFSLSESPTYSFTNDYFTTSHSELLEAPGGKLSIYHKFSSGIGIFGGFTGGLYCGVNKIFSFPKKSAIVIETDLQLESQIESGNENEYSLYSENRKIRLESSMLSPGVSAAFSKDIESINKWWGLSLKVGGQLRMVSMTHENTTDNLKKKSHFFIGGPSATVAIRLFKYLGLHAATSLGVVSTDDLSDAQEFQLGIKGYFGR
ncbi:MAG: hypothetical protein OCC49_18045 [Fibrobacterales bacterium]